MDMMRTLIYGNAKDYDDTSGLLRAMTREERCRQEHLHAKNREDLKKHLVEWEPHLVVVLEDGAEGMEGVYVVRDTRPAIPLFWFSDDENFGVHSHRLECDYFSTKPITREKMEKALNRCEHVGVLL